MQSDQTPVLHETRSGLEAAASDVKGPFFTATWLHNQSASVSTALQGSQKETCNVAPCGPRARQHRHFLDVAARRRHDVQ